MFFLILIIAIFTPYTLTQFRYEDLETAPFVSSRSENGYEERRYESMKWACHTSTQKRFISRLMQPQLFELFKYTAGENSQRQKMPMTMPITMTYTKNSKGNEEGEMCIYIPQAYQNDPPKPVEPLISIVEKPAMVVLARSFIGIPTRRDDWDKEAQELKSALEAAKEKGVIYDNFISASYDAPNRRNERKNEIWYIKKI